EPNSGTSSSASQVCREPHALPIYAGEQVQQRMIQSAGNRGIVVVGPFCISRLDRHRGIASAIKHGKIHIAPRVLCRTVRKTSGYNSTSGSGYFVDLWLAISKESRKSSIAWFTSDACLKKTLIQPLSGRM